MPRGRGPSTVEGGVRAPDIDDENRSKQFPAPTSGIGTDAPVEVRVELAPNIFLSIAMSDDVAISRADVAAIRAAAAPLIAELASRRFATHAEEGDDK
jgi:hypothetical protein